MNRKKKHFFDEMEIGHFPIVEKPNRENTLIDITLFDKLTFTPIKKIKKRSTKKALKELDEVLDQKG